MMKKKIFLTWQTGHHSEKTEKPVDFIPASVPGAVQLDFAKANDYGAFWYAKNWKDYLWMEDTYWTYRADFSKPETDDYQKILFISKGIDYQYEIYLNSELLYAYEGMFAPVELDITKNLKQSNRLEVLIYPAPKSHNKALDRFQADQSCKPAVSYGWDWHPRLIPLGIWDETFLEIVPAHRILDAGVNYVLSEKMDNAAVNLSLEVTAAAVGHDYIWTIRDTKGKAVLVKEGKIEEKQMSVSGKLKQIELWWPHGYGDQPLYVSCVELSGSGNVVDSRTEKIGFRKVALVMNEGTWDEPLDFPKSRSNAPITLEINGKRIFTKGSNWVPPEIFPGLITKERYEDLLNLAVEANLDMMRVWGGGIINKACFYDLCDEKGILVWQEFPLACNNYKGTEAYLQTLKNEANAIVLRLRRHASIVIWCGGNELFNVWSGMTDQSAAIRLLNKICYEHAPNIPFLSTAPVVGMGHGPYGFLDPVTKEEMFVKMKNARNTAYSECSSTGPSTVETIKRIIPAEELFPPKPNTAWQDHHGFEAWDAEPESHLLLSMLEKYFGPAKNLEELVENGQFIQSAGMQCLFEEGRRQKPYCSMVLTWCYNEVWPCVAGGSAIAWPKEPKPAYYAMQQSCRPVLVSAQIEKLMWAAGDVFVSDIWLLNDAFNPVEPCMIHVSVEGDEQIDIMDWHCPGTEPNNNVQGPKMKFILPHWNSKKFKLKLSVKGHCEWDSEYELLYDKKEKSRRNKGMNV